MLVHCQKTMAKLERGRWTGTVDVTLPDIDSVLQVRLQNVLFIKEVKKKTLVGKIIWED